MIFIDGCDFSLFSLIYNDYGSSKHILSFILKKNIYIYIYIFTPFGLSKCFDERSSYCGYEKCTLPIYQYKNEVKNQIMGSFFAS